MKIVLAYSGGLDTSVLLRWLVEQGHEVIACCADVGQEEELDGLEEKALATGAVSCEILDLREEFAKDFIFPMFRAGAIYEGQYFLGTSIARPVIAKGLVNVAKKYNADAIAHGATGKGNDQVRFELAINALAPELKVVAPWRDEAFRADFPGRSAMIQYCEENNIDVQATASKPYSMDRNLLHISFEAGVLEDLEFNAFSEENKGMFVLSVAPEDAPDEREEVSLEFFDGDCVSVNGGEIGSPLEIMKLLNKLGGKHGIGRVDMVEDRFVGMKSRGVYETPGGVILFSAHRHMESITMDRATMILRDGLIPQYSEMVYNGFWFAPERLALQALIDESQKGITGTVTLKLWKGNIMVVNRYSPNSLYDPQIATMDEDPTDSYDQGDATGFIRLNGLRLRVHSSVHPNKYS